MRKTVKVLTIAASVAVSGCGSAPSSSTANAVNQNMMDAGMSADSRMEKAPLANDPPKLRIPVKVRIGTELVDDDVPASAIPMIKRSGELMEQCLRLEKDSLCDESEKIEDELYGRNVCRGRWSDPLDSEGQKLPSWHICDSTSWRTNGI